MRIFVAGSSGFIGGALVAALGRAGHEVTCAARLRDAGSGCAHFVRVDFAADFDRAAWHGRLAGSEIVVNAVGLIRERRAQTFDAVHRRAPIAMFGGALDAGVRRVVQISALGADAEAQSRFHLSKKAADDFLALLPLDWVIAQPSLVFGPGGTSARLFSTLASLPLIPLPGRGDGPVQPIHVDDLVEALLHVIEWPHPQRLRIALVGPRPMPFREFVASLRWGLGLGPPLFVRVPEPIMRPVARVSTLLPGSLLDPESLGMLKRGNTADARATRDILGRDPRDVVDFVPADQAAAERQAAGLAWTLPPLRWSIALVWIVSGIVSLGVYPASDSLAMLARVGIQGLVAPVMLHAAAVLDIALGLATVALRRRRLLWLIQAAVIVAYTAIISVKLPEFWAHPFGPVLKNLPMLAAIGLLYTLERR